MLCVCGQAVVFDKTGTLTAGKPSVASFDVIDVETLRKQATAERNAAQLSSQAACVKADNTIVLDVVGMKCMKNCGTPVQNVLSEADLAEIGVFLPVSLVHSVANF